MKIKFRAKTLSDDCGAQYVYGLPSHYIAASEDDEGESDFVDHWFIKSEDHLHTFEVDPETIAQLLWVDDFGNEIYEGDKFVIEDEDGTELTLPLLAKMTSTVAELYNKPEGWMPLEYKIKRRNL